jgi:hypothetical protein
MSHNSMGLHGLLQGKLYHYVILKTVTVWCEDVQVYEMFMNMINSQACGCHLQEVNSVYNLKSLPLLRSQS